MIPEQTFFPDPALDRAFGVVMALAQEVWVLRERVAGMEAQLAEREAFVAHLMQNLLGQQQAKGTR